MVIMIGGIECEGGVCNVVIEDYELEIPQ